MHDLLVGSTGFVGGNLAAAHAFTASCHSSDVSDQFGTQPDLCVYAGVPSAMFLANRDPDADFAVMETARENLRRITPKQVVLLSTIAVFSDSRGKTEQARPDTGALSAYGKNRLQLERWVREDFPSACILRLPALYGLGLKKNFLYDLHTIVPKMLSRTRYLSLCACSPLVEQSYALGANDFFVCKPDCDWEALQKWFATADFNALSFTDSRSTFQYYPLRRLWQDMEGALRKQLPLVHLCTPPVSAQEVYAHVMDGRDWVNHIEDKPPFAYDLRSQYAAAFGGVGDYLCTKEQELADIVAFMKHYPKRGTSQ